MGRRKKPTGPSARPVQIGEQLRHALSEMFLEGALKDPRIARASMITVTDVRMTPDLKLARVLVSVYPEDPEVLAAVHAGLDAASKEVQREIAARLHLRFTPVVRFEADDSIREGARIEAILREIRAETPSEEE